MLKSSVIRSQHWFYNVNVFQAIYAKNEKKYFLYGKRKLLSLNEKLKSLSSYRRSYYAKQGICMLKSAVIRSQHWYYNVNLLNNFAKKRKKYVF